MVCETVRVGISHKTTNYFSQASWGILVEVYIGSAVFARSFPWSSLDSHCKKKKLYRCVIEHVLIWNSKRRYFWTFIIACPGKSSWINPWAIGCDTTRLIFLTVICRPVWQGTQHGGGNWKHFRIASSTFVGSRSQEQDQAPYIGKFTVCTWVVFFSLSRTSCQGKIVATSRRVLQKEMHSLWSLCAVIKHSFYSEWIQSWKTDLFSLFCMLIHRKTLKRFQFQLYANLCIRFNCPGIPLFHPYCRPFVKQTCRILFGRKGLLVRLHPRFQKCAELWPHQNTIRVSRSCWRSPREVAQAQRVIF